MQVYQLQCWTLRCLWGSSEGRFWSNFWSVCRTIREECNQKFESQQFWHPKECPTDAGVERPMGTLEAEHPSTPSYTRIDYFSSFSKRCGPDELNLPKRGWCASQRIDQAHWSVAVLKLCSKCLSKWCSKIVYIVAWHIRNHTTTQHAWIALILESFIMHRITHTHILISNQHADDQQWTVLTSPFNPVCNDPAARRLCCVAMRQRSWRQCNRLLQRLGLWWKRHQTLGNALETSQRTFLQIMQYI